MLSLDQKTDRVKEAVDIWRKYFDSVSEVCVNFVTERESGKLYIRYLLKC